jgi:hypothetical protein
VNKKMNTNQKFRRTNQDGEGKKTTINILAI